MKSFLKYVLFCFLTVTLSQDVFTQDVSTYGKGALQKMFQALPYKAPKIETVGTPVTQITMDGETVTVEYGPDDSYLQLKYHNEFRGRIVPVAQDPKARIYINIKSAKTGHFLLVAEFTPEAEKSVNVYSATKMFDMSSEATSAVVMTANYDASGNMKTVEIYEKQGAVTTFYFNSEGLIERKRIEDKQGHMTHDMLLYPTTEDPFFDKGFKVKAYASSEGNADAGFFYRLQGYNGNVFTVSSVYGQVAAGKRYDPHTYGYDMDWDDGNKPIYRVRVPNGFSAGSTIYEYMEYYKDNIEQGISLAKDSPNVDEAKKLFNTGRQKYINSLYEEAVRYLTSVIDLCPSYIPSYIWRARAYKNKGEYRKALDDLNKVSELYNVRSISDGEFIAPIYYEKGLVKNLMGYYDGAIEDLNKAATLVDQKSDIESEINYELGIASSRNGNLLAARIYFSNSINMDKKAGRLINYRAHYERGLVYMNSKGTTHEVDLLDKAAADFAEVVRLKTSENVEVDPIVLYTCYNNLGNIYAAKQEYEKSVEYYSEAIKLDPDHSAAYYGRAATYRLMEKMDLAAIDVNEAAALDDFSEPGTKDVIVKNYTNFETLSPSSIIEQIPN
ncbi:MAG: tetratricopeptide repeat protein, partial [Pseudomonadota bacterium]